MLADRPTAARPFVAARHRLRVPGQRVDALLLGDPPRDALPNATFVEVPGTHMSSVTKPEFGAALAEFLDVP